MNSCIHICRALTLAPGTIEELACRVLMSKRRAEEAIYFLLRAGGVTRTRARGSKTVGRGRYVYSLVQ